LSSESHPQQPKAKRQRLPLTEQTFVNPDAPQEPDAIAKKPEKVPVAELKNDNIENLHHTPRKDVSVRAKKTKHSDRAANKGDGSLVLVGSPLLWSLW
jgi:nuclear pore complex protein Nup133